MAKTTLSFSIVFGLKLWKVEHILAMTSLPKDASLCHSLRVKLEVLLPVLMKSL